MAYLAPSLARLRSQVALKWPSRSKAADGWIGDAAHASRDSDHNPDPVTGVVRAIDFTVNTAQGTAILAAVWQDPRTFYVIWRRQIYYRGETRPRPYAGLNAHMGHIHISIDRKNKSAETDTTLWKGLGMARMQSPVKGWVSSEFSRSRRNPVTGRVEPHLGIDIAAPEGAPYYPVYPGTVIGVGAGLLPGRSGDRNVRVRNPDGETQYYGHGGTASVKVGQKVDHTTPLGTVGQRGNATGPHVHLEIHDKNGVPRDPRIDFAHHGVIPGEPPTGAATTAPKLPLDEGIDMKHTANTYNKPRQSAPKGKWRVLDVKPPSKSGRHISFLGRNTTTALAVVRAAIQGLGPDDYIEFQVFHVKYDPKNGNGPVQALLRHRVTGSQALKGRDSYLDLTRTLGAVPAGHRWRVRAQASKAGVTVSHLSIDVFQ